MVPLSVIPLPMQYGFKSGKGAGRLEAGTKITIPNSPARLCCDTLHIGRLPLKIWSERKMTSTGLCPEYLADTSALERNDNNLILERKSEPMIDGGNSLVLQSGHNSVHSCYWV